MGKAKARPKAQQPRKKGRPTSYSRAIAEKVLEQLGEGKTLTKITKQPGYPKASTLFRWLAENADFREAYAQARELRGEMLVSELVALADRAQGMLPEGVAAMKLRIDTRKWVASKFYPKVYADRIDHTSDGGPLAGLAIIVPMKALAGASAEAKALASTSTTEANPLTIQGESVRVDA
jgi:hypothetical protein